jgi:toxin YoeB
VNLLWTEEAWEDYLYWHQADRDVWQKVNALVKDVQRNPFHGLGKPEPLKGSLKGWWSRRITGDHRLVYRCAGKGQDQNIEISQCRYHY